MYSETTRVFYKEVNFRIDVDPAGFRFFERTIGGQADCPSHLILKDLPPFWRQRNYELYVRFNGYSFCESREEPGMYCSEMSSVRWALRRQPKTG